MNVNNKKFRIYPNNSIRLGDLLFCPIGDMFMCLKNYTQHIISSNNMPWDIEPINQYLIKENVLSNTEYDFEDKISINLKKAQEICINEYILIIAYREKDSKSKLMKGKKIVKESESLLELYNIAISA